MTELPLRLTAAGAASESEMTAGIGDTSAAVVLANDVVAMLSQEARSLHPRLPP